jgi:cytochrome c553
MHRPPESPAGDFFTRWHESMKFLRPWPVVFAAALLGQIAHAADVEAGKKSAQVCLACHGATGVSQLPDTPSLAGQTDTYIQWQLVYFRSGSRRNPIMGPLASALGDPDIRNLGAYFASLPAPGPVTGADDAGLSKRGAAIAKANRCANCHGGKFEGVQAAPRITRQREDYLLKSLRDFKSGARTGGGLASMPEAVFPLKDDDFKALAHFLSRLP